MSLDLRPTYLDLDLLNVNNDEGRRASSTLRVLDDGGHRGSQPPSARPAANRQLPTFKNTAARFFLLDYSTTQLLDCSTARLLDYSTVRLLDLSTF